MTGVIRPNREVDMPTSSGTTRGNPPYTVIKISYEVVVRGYRLSVIGTLQLISYQLDFFVAVIGNTQKHCQAKTPRPNVLTDNRKVLLTDRLLKPY